MSGFVAHKLSGFHTIPRRYRYKMDRMVTEDTKNEIRRSVWRLAGQAFDARRSGTGAGCMRENVPAILTDMKMKAWKD